MSENCNKWIRFEIYSTEALIKTIHVPAAMMPTVTTNELGRHIDGGGVRHASVPLCFSIIGELIDE